MADYLAQRGDLATEAGQLAHLFCEPTLQEQFDQAGRNYCWSSAWNWSTTPPARARTRSDGGPRKGVPAQGPQHGSSVSSWAAGLLSLCGVTAGAARRAAVCPANDRPPFGLFSIGVALYGEHEYPGDLGFAGVPAVLVDARPDGAGTAARGPRVEQVERSRTEEVDRLVLVACVVG
ncbi:hypothetical protein SHKM778_96020 (plasmid) [Streptomyces sp. KM77-8]|uniref:Uncharacterized protein n=1 Tax=Streptomyces haneummycinicus TaxID=3074435 RepID=A0AAT9I097_9ACTN